MVPFTVPMFPLPELSAASVPVLSSSFSHNTRFASGSATTLTVSCDAPVPAAVVAAHCKT